MYSKEYLTNLSRQFHYETALVLFREYGNSPFMLKMFERSQTSFNAEKLKEFVKELLAKFDDLAKPIAEPTEVVELQKHIKKLEQPQIVSPSNISELPQYSLARYANAPQEVQDLVTEIKRNYRIEDSLFATLELLPSDEERCKAALQILDLSDRIREIWTLLLHYDTHKVLPIIAKKEDSKVVLTDIADLIKRKNTLKANISRDKKSRPHKVKQWEDELQEIEKQINKG